MSAPVYRESGDTEPAPRWFLITLLAVAEQLLEQPDSPERAAKLARWRAIWQRVKQL